MKPSRLMYFANNVINAMAVIEVETREPFRSTYPLLEEKFWSAVRASDVSAMTDLLCQIYPKKMRVQPEAIPLIAVIKQAPPL